MSKCPRLLRLAGIAAGFALFGEFCPADAQSVDEGLPRVTRLRPGSCAAAMQAILSRNTAEAEKLFTELPN